MSLAVIHGCTLLHIAFSCLKRRIISSKINWKHRAEPTQSTTADLELCSADFLSGISYLSFRCQLSNSRHLPVAQVREKIPCVKQHTEKPNNSEVTCIKLSEYPFYGFVIIIFYGELIFNQPAFCLFFQISFWWSLQPTETVYHSMLIMC